MSLVIRFYEASEPEETVWLLNFDAVTEYSRSTKGSVAKHPVDREGEVNDHFSLQNKEYRIAGIVSHADISVDASLIKDPYGNKPTNENPQPSPVVVEGGNNGLLSKLIPDSIGQFIPSKPPKVLLNPLANSGGGLRADWTNFVRGKLEQSMKYPKVIPDVDTKKSREVFFPLIAEVYRFDRNGVVTENVVRDLILTSVEEKEDAESNSALFLNLVLEEVRFVSIESEAVNSSKVGEGLGEKVSEPKKLGDTTNTVVKGGELGDGGGNEGDSSNASKIGDWVVDKGKILKDRTLNAMGEFFESWKGGWGN